MGIDDYPYVISQPLGITFGVSKLPFAAIIDEAGVLASKGLVNTREHLDSLVEATHSEHKTIQEYVSQDGFSVEGFEEKA
jgi:methylamine dehydrogenase accessory protein MauD